MSDTPMRPLPEPMKQRDENNIPYVRLTRTVQSGFGLGIGIALAQVAIFGALLLVVVFFRLLL